MKKSKKAPAKKTPASVTRAQLSALASKLAPAGGAKPTPPVAAGQKQAVAAPAAKDSRMASWTYSLNTTRAQAMEDRKRELMVLAMDQGVAPSDITLSAVIRLGILRLGHSISSEIGSLASWHSETPETKGTAGAAAFVLTDPVKAAMFEVEKAAVMRGLPLGPSGLSRARIIEYALNSPFSKSDYAKWKANL